METLTEEELYWLKKWSGMLTEVEAMDMARRKQNKRMSHDHQKMGNSVKIVKSQPSSDGNNGSTTFEYNDGEIATTGVLTWQGDEMRGFQDGEKGNSNFPDMFEFSLELGDTGSYPEGDVDSAFDMKYFPPQKSDPIAMLRGVAINTPNGVRVDRIDVYNGFKPSNLLPDSGVARRVGRTIAEIVFEKV